MVCAELDFEAFLRRLQSQLSSPADIRFLALDLSSFKSIRAAADKFKSDSGSDQYGLCRAGLRSLPPSW
jgi:hypothetical protein